MAFTNLRVDNFTLTDSLVFTNTNSPSDQDNYAFCQVRIKPRTFIFRISKILQGYPKGDTNKLELTVNMDQFQLWAHRILFSICHREFP